MLGTLRSQSCFRFLLPLPCCWPAWAWARTGRAAGAWHAGLQPCSAHAFSIAAAMSQSSQSVQINAFNSLLIVRRSTPHCRAEAETAYSHGTQMAVQVSMHQRCFNGCWCYRLCKHCVLVADVRATLFIERAPVGYRVKAMRPCLPRWEPVITTSPCLICRPKSTMTRRSACASSSAPRRSC